MNRKGFMMAELVVVSSIVLVTLVGLYSSYNNIYSTYKTRLGYYDVTTLYRLGYYRDILKENEILDDVVDSAKNQGIVTVYNSNDTASSIFSLPSTERTNNKEDKVYMIYNNKDKINSSVFDGKDVNATFRDYADFLEGSVENFSEFNCMMIMERCTLKDDGSVNIDDCNYAYLEIFEPK